MCLVCAGLEWACYTYRRIGVRIKTEYIIREDFIIPSKDKLKYIIETSVLNVEQGVGLYGGKKKKTTSRETKTRTVVKKGTKSV